MKYSIFFLAFFISSMAIAQEPGMSEIRTKALSFIRSKAASKSQIQKSVPDYSIEKISTISQDGQDMYNVVEMSPGGFVVLSNNKTIDPLIAYSLSSDFDFSSDTSNVLYHMILEDLRR